jgi:hypothetical protein
VATKPGGRNRTEVEQLAIPADHAKRYQRVEHPVEQPGRLAGETAHQFAAFDRAEFCDPRHDLAGQAQPGGRQFLVQRAFEKLRGTKPARSHQDGMIGAERLARRHKPPGCRSA